MRILARLLTAGLVLAILLGASGCGGGEVSPGPTDELTPKPEPIKLKLINSQPADSTGGQVNSYFADLVEEYTNGQVVVDIYPGSQLFPATEQWEALVTGAIDMYADSTYYISPFIPDVMISYIDGVFESYKHAYAVLEESEFPRILAEKIEEAGPVKTLGILPGAMAMCVSNSVRETKHLKDCEGFRTQSSPGTPSIPLYDYAGMAAVPISYEETPAAFIQGVIDAVHFPPTAIKDLKLYETGKHMLCRYSLFFVGVLCVNKSAWESLPADIQDIIVNEVMPEVYEYHKLVFREDEDTALQIIEQNVETVNWVEQDDFDSYIESSLTHPTYKVQMLMIDPEILEVIDGIRPSSE
jgi:TRAP-type C4-dicarboxylate transport system substrate-binding protein